MDDIDEEYSGFDTLGTSIDDAFSDDIEMDEDVDEVEYDSMSDE